MHRKILPLLSALLYVISPLRADTVIGTPTGDTDTTPTPATDSSTTATISSDAERNAPKKSPLPIKNFDREIISEKIEETPHFWQRDPDGHFANDGRDYCCPVAVSDSLCYFAHHGFPTLLSESDEPQIDLINTLASPAYLNTNPDKGNTPSDLLRGVEKYIEEKGYPCTRLEYEGWRKLPRNQASKIIATRVDLNWVKQGIDEPHGTVWLNMGLYLETSPEQWTRCGGHWLTLVGYDPKNPQRFIVRNSLAKGNDPANDQIDLHSLQSIFLHPERSANIDATGMYEITGPQIILRRKVHAVLDTAVVLVLGS